MAFTTVHLMRHGEVNNPDGLLYGRMSGFGLTPLGLEMAQVVAEFLVEQEKDITQVIASPLLRAQESALPTALAYDLPIGVDSELIEAASSFEGVAVNRNRWALAHPQNWQYYKRPLEPSWGEPHRQILSRMRSAISTAIDAAWGHEALFVSHQLPIVTVQRFIEGKPLSHNPLWRKCSLASLTSLLFEDYTLVGWTYSQPAESLLSAAQDVTPGSSPASVNEG